MKKFLIPALAVTIGLSACQKPADTPAEAQSSPAQTDTPQANAPQADSTSATTPEQHSHAHGEHAHDHSHAGHDHSHAYDHEEKFQCGDKTVYLTIHDHEGEIEAHLTVDNITYDLEQDVQNKGRFTTDDGIQGDDKGMALVLDGDNAKITALDDSVLLDCTKVKAS
ncbi:MAG: hypothetical protein Q3971_08155 [Moraxella sp.]|nr:hypothetical protein [Moraxella sp.]